MEYGNVVWGGTFDTDLIKLEKIHVDGMRLVTGATARSNIANLYTETCWKSLNERWETASLIMMFKMKNKMCPEYLTNLLPPENNETIGYNLRNNQNIVIPAARLESLKRSFIHQAINLWNKLPLELRQVPNLEEFRFLLKEKHKDCNILYYYGKRWPSLHHSRIRIGCSKLKSDLCFNLHVIEDPLCYCGEIEDAHHYFLHCPNYLDIRINLFSFISAYAPVSLDIILYGKNELSLELNKLIFDAVFEFIEKSHRFT